jgi:hypothetical protein
MKSKNKDAESGAIRVIERALAERSMPQHRAMLETRRNILKKLILRYRDAHPNKPC